MTALDAHLLGKLFIVWRIHAAVSTGLLRWMAEEFLMRFQAGLPLLRVGRVAVQDTIVADNSAVYFIKPDFMTVFHRFRFFAATDNIGVRLKEADNFFLRRNLFVLKHAPFDAESIACSAMGMKFSNVLTNRWAYVSLFIL